MLVLNEPFLSDLEQKYVLDVLESSWLSANGKHTKIFEAKFAAYIGLKHSLAVQSGTAALHVVLKAIGVAQGDAVVLPNFSCGSTISSVVQCGGVPVVLDVEAETYGLDASRLESAIKKFRPKVVQFVHVYGFPARDALLIQDLCKTYRVCLVEDASEAFGATLDNRMIGQFGDVSVFSIRSEKMIGVGEGGVIATNNTALYERIACLASRSAPFRSGGSPYWAKYFYDGEGYNYLLPHLLGAVARAQIERFEAEILPAKQQVGTLYRQALASVAGVSLQKIAPGARPAYWLNSVRFDDLEKNEVRELGDFLMTQGIEVRSGFWPLCDMSAFRAETFGPQDIGYQLFHRLLVLPSSYRLRKEDIAAIRDVVLGFLERRRGN